MVNEADMSLVWCLVQDVPFWCLQVHLCAQFCVILHILTVSQSAAASVSQPWGVCVLHIARGWLNNNVSRNFLFQVGLARRLHLILRSACLDTLVHKLQLNYFDSLCFEINHSRCKIQQMSAQQRRAVWCFAHPRFLLSADNVHSEMYKQLCSCFPSNASSPPLRDSVPYISTKKNAISASSVLIRNG